MASSDVSNPSRLPPVSLGSRYLRWVMGFASPIRSPYPLVAVVHGHRWTRPIAERPTNRNAWAHIDYHQQLALGVHCRPDPVRRTLQVLNRLIVGDLTGFELSQHCVQLVELQLLQVQITQKISGKGAQLLSCFGQPVQHRVGVDFEDPSHGTNAPALSQAGQDAYNQLDCRLFAVEDHAVGIVSKPVRRPVDKLTTFQEIRGGSIRRKRHSDRRLELLDRVEQAVKVVNCRLSSLRRSRAVHL
jgi:hypothetical protein